MYQFTTTNVINSNKDLTTGKDLWKAEDASGAKPAKLSIKRVANFIAPNVTAIYKAEAKDVEFAKATIDFSQVSGAQGDVFRLHIYVGLTQASQESTYANDMQFKGKPLSVDFVWADNAANTVANLVKIINKYELMVYGRKLLNVSNNSTFLTIEATDEYQRFRFLNIEKFDGEVYHGMGEYTVVRSLADLDEKETNAEVTASAEGFFAGKEGFGTYSFLLHNLRIPTHDRTRFLALNQDETPIIGAKYNQYTIHYCVNRGILGSNAVGDMVKSKTTHVFYVNQSVSSEFETALAKIGSVITVDGPGTANPDTVVGDIVELEKKVAAIEASLAKKQDTISAGNGIDISGNAVSVKLDGDTLTASAKGLKVTDGKFTEA